MGRFWVSVFCVLGGWVLVGVGFCGLGFSFGRLGFRWVGFGFW